MVDWKHAEEESNYQEYKQYAPDGEYKVKLAKVTVKDSPNWKSPCVEFEWEEDDQYAYPKSTAHWLSLAKPGWRAIHQRGILMELGIKKEDAEKAIDAAEKDQDREKLVKAYQAMYDRLVQHHPEANIVIVKQYREGKPVLASNGKHYSHSDFASSSVRMAEAAPKSTPAEDMGEVAEDIDLGDIPF